METNKLKNFELEKHFEEAKSMSFYGVPVDELTKDELMVGLLMMKNCFDRERESHKSSLSFMRSLRK